MYFNVKNIKRDIGMNEYEKLKNRLSKIKNRKPSIFAKFRKTFEETYSDILAENKEMDIESEILLGLDSFYFLEQYINLQKTLSQAKYIFSDSVLSYDEFMEKEKEHFISDLTEKSVNERLLIVKKKVEENINQFIENA